MNSTAVMARSGCQDWKVGAFELGLSSFEKKMNQMTL
jgi:hypothetical protein